MAATVGSTEGAQWGPGSTRGLVTADLMGNDSPQSCREVVQNLVAECDSGPKFSTWLGPEDPN